ncbi:MAG: hypothetical protein OEX81_00540 [Candidatus Pacebacteria bacterium]|nr:hypothetical protein [Candidatus Paceibacterota bacterium]
MKSRILHAILENGEPVAVQELVGGKWQDVDLSEYFSLAYDIRQIEDEDSITGISWDSEDVDFAVDSLADIGQPPTADRAQSIFEDLINAVIEDDDYDEELDDINEGVVFVFDQAA